MGGPLKTSIACSSNKEITFYDINHSLITAKHNWTAHDDVITLLKRNFYGISMFSGAANGSIHFWDLKSRPINPNIKMLRHTKSVTSVEQINENCFYSSSLDSYILMWDIRNPQSPIQTLCPDRKNVISIKIHPNKEVLAATTEKGLYTISLSKNFPMTPLTNLNQKMNFADICYDVKSGVLYTGKTEGDIALY